MNWYTQGGRPIRRPDGIATDEDCCCPPPPPPAACVCADIPATVYYHSFLCGDFTIAMTEIATTEPGARVWRGSGPVPVTGNTVIVQFGCKPPAIVDEFCHVWWCVDGCGGIGLICDPDQIDVGGGWLSLGQIIDGSDFLICPADTAPSSDCNNACFDPWEHCFSSSATPPP